MAFISGKIMFLRLFFVAILAAIRPSFAIDVPADGPSMLAKLISREYRALEDRRQSLLSEISTLPAPSKENTTARLGWHSPRLQSAGTNLRIQIDLGEIYPIDYIALIPARAQFEMDRNDAYGFPLRFRIETSEDEGFVTSKTIADETGADVPNPGAYPYVVRCTNVKARYLLLEVTQAWRRNEDWIVALGEILVISRGSNVAARRPVRARQSLTALPFWHASYLTDEHSFLGAPAGVVSSPSNGFLAAHETETGSHKWVQVDLGQEYTLDEVRLLPARPTDFADAPGSGFPVTFRVEADVNAEFHTRRLLFDTGEREFPPPGENPVTIITPGHRARYVRVTATKLQDRGNVSTFALAELQTWSEGRNVALGGDVSYLDRFEMAAFPRWQPGYLTDGYNSRHALLNWPEWLIGLDRRRQLEVELAGNAKRRSAAMSTVLITATQIGGGALGVVATVAGLLLWRARVVRIQAVEVIQRRIARDLHDEIGSYIGSIGLISEAARRLDAPQAVDQDLSEINRIAARTGQSLREIVWLLDLRPISRTELIGQMREAAPVLLSGTPFTFSAPSRPSPRICAVEMTRNVWLVYKEALHNVAKHSAATSVRITVTEPGNGFVLEIADNGRGFDPSATAGGRGLNHLRQRAVELRASLVIESAAGMGTTVRLEIPPT